MKYIWVILICIITLSTNTWSQPTEEEIRNAIEKAIEITKWEMTCREGFCIFKRDVYHNKGNELALITIFIAVEEKSQEVTGMTIYYPGTASMENGGLFAFISNTESNGEFTLDAQSDTMTRLPFTFCVEDGCEMPVIPNEIFKPSFVLKEKLLNSSHLWMLYMNDGQAIRSLAALFSFQEQFAEKFTEK